MFQDNLSQYSGLDEDSNAKRCSGLLDCSFGDKTSVKSFGNRYQNQYINFPKELIEKINESQNVLLIGHLMPDADCVGALLATKEILERKGKSVTILLEDGMPKKFGAMLPKWSKGKICTSLDDNDKNYSLAITLDCASRDRMGDGISASLDKIPGLSIINIDHHFQSNDSFGNLNYVGGESSACEIVFSLATALNVDIRALSKYSLFYLHNGIMADTRGLKVGAVSDNTRSVVNFLKETCTDYELRRLSFKLRKNSEYMGDLIERVVVENIGDFSEPVTVSYITQDSLKSIGLNSADCTGLAGALAKDSKSVINVLVVEKLNDYDITVFSCENRSDITALDIVKKISDTSGGHQHAAGALVKKSAVDSSLNEVKNLITNAISCCDCV